MTTDKQGRPYARLSELCVGAKIVCDGGFTCMKEGDIKTVEFDDAIGEFWIECDDGRHYLEGQLDDDDLDTLIGLYRA